MDYGYELECFREKWEFQKQKIKMRKNIRIHKGFWTRDEVARDVDSVYVFGDNCKDAIGTFIPETTQACIRFLPNTIGISTKKDHYWNDHSFMNDNDIDLFSALVETAIGLIKVNLEKGKTIVFPSDGIGTGNARLLKKAPLCWEYLCKRLKEEFNYDNGQE